MKSPIKCHLQKIKAHTFLSIDSTSLPSIGDCADLCFSTSPCHGWHYNEDSGTCDLHVESEANVVNTGSNADKIGNVNDCYHRFHT